MLMTNRDIADPMLLAYVEDALGETETAAIEQRLRSDSSLLARLRELLRSQEQGDHSVGAIWRRRRLTCPSRDQLGSYLLDALDPPRRDYIDFHLGEIACAFCQANLEDLRTHEPASPTTAAFRRRVFDSSATLL